jgi:hypothetical protein
MIIGLVYLAILASVPLARGRLSALADLPLRKPGLAAAAIGLQVLIISVIPGGHQAFHTTVHMLSYVLLGAFAFFNRHIPGVIIAGLGGLSNFIVIAANGGVMPTNPDTLASFQGADTKGEFANSAILEHPKLMFLGDTIATPSSLPLHTVFSVGDLFLMLGVAILVHTACGSKLVPRRLRRAAVVPA